MTWIDLLVLAYEPVAQAGAPGDAPREFGIHDSQLAQFDERRVVVGWRGLASLGNQVVVDVDHPADHSFEHPLDDRLIQTILEERREWFCRERRHRVQVLGNQQQFSRHQLAIDGHCASAWILRLTYSRSIARNRRWS